MFHDATRSKVLIQYVSTRLSNKSLVSYLLSINISELIVETNTINPPIAIGVTRTHRPIFSMPFPNRSEWSEAVWWLFLEMAGLQMSWKLLLLP